MQLIQDRTQKLSGLSRWHTTWCQVESRPTAPALARYSQMYPQDVEALGDQPLMYTWKARKTTCELNPLSSSALSKSHQAILEQAFCLMIQAHWVNSPFDEFNYTPDDVLTAKSGQVHILGTGVPRDSALGVYLDPNSIHLRTKTKSHGELNAEYIQRGDQWVWTHLDQVLDKATIAIEQPTYSDTRLNERPTLTGFTLLLGESQPLPQSTISIFDCRNY